MLESMERRAGFTLIELLITITIMVVLLTLTVVNLRSTQANARDEKRRTDIANIARGLEAYYDNGDFAHGIDRGYYPGAQQVADAYSASPPYATKEFLPGVPESSFQAPNKDTGNSFYYDTAKVGGVYSDSAVRTALATTPYLYQPLTRSDTFCDSWTDCVKFNLYYLTEVDDMVHTVRSKNQ